MAVCASCGKTYDPDIDEKKYDNDSFITDHNLEGTYGNFIDECAKCAIRECMSSFGAYD